MKLNEKMKLLNYESRPGVKDPSKIYNVVLFMQGTQTLEIMTDSDVMKEVQKVGVMKDVQPLFDYNPNYKSLRLVGILV